MPRKTRIGTLRAQLGLLREMDVAQAAFDEKGDLKAVMFRPPRPAPVQEQRTPQPRLQIPKELRDAGFDEQRVSDAMAGIGWD